MKNLFILFGLVCLAGALVLDAANVELASSYLLAGTCTLALCALGFFALYMHAARQERDRSTLFTRRAHEQDAHDRTFECDGITDFPPPKRFIMKHDPFNR